MSKIHVDATVNGEPVEFLCEPRQTLLDVLRDDLASPAPRKAAARGDCGACSVHVDGRLVSSCLVLARRGRGPRRSTTIEGMANGRAAASAPAEVPRARGAAVRLLHAGLLVAAKALLDQQPGPDRDRGALLAGGQPVPLHRLRQDRPRRAGRRRRCMREDEERIATMTRDERSRRSAEYVGTRPIRPDGVDKVTGRAQLRRRHRACRACCYGKVLRSPHAHARILRIDTTRRAGAAGREGGRHRGRLPRRRDGAVEAGEGAVDAARPRAATCMARDKVLYHGPRGGRGRRDVAPTSPRQALALIEVEYEVLPPCIDVDAAMAAGRAAAARRPAHRGMRPRPDAAVERRRAACELERGDVDDGLRARPTWSSSASSRPRRSTRATSSRTPAWPRWDDGRPASASGAARRAHFMVRAMRAERARASTSRDIKVIAAEIGGGFGGKTTIYLEPVALAAVAQERAAGQDGDDARGGVPRHRPDLGLAIAVKIGAKQRRHASPRPRRRLDYEAGRVPGLAGRPGRMTASCACYDIANVRSRRLRRGGQQAEGRGLPRAGRADARSPSRARRRAGAKLGMDPLELRLKNAAQEGTQRGLRRRPSRASAARDACEAAKAHPHYAAPLRAEPGPRRGDRLLVQRRRASRAPRCTSTRTAA